MLVFIFDTGAAEHFIARDFFMKRHAAFGAIWLCDKCYLIKTIGTKPIDFFKDFATFYATRGKNGVNDAG
jgi:hypothetical protein